MLTVVMIKIPTIMRQPFARPINTMRAPSVKLGADAWSGTLAVEKLMVAANAGVILPSKNATGSTLPAVVRRTSVRIASSVDVAATGAVDVGVLAAPSLPASMDRKLAGYVEIRIRVRVRRHKELRSVA